MLSLCCETCDDAILGHVVVYEYAFGNMDVSLDDYCVKNPCWSA